jgi:hypothetical protein
VLGQSTPASIPFPRQDGNHRKHQPEGAGITMMSKSINPKLSDKAFLKTRKFLKDYEEELRSLWLWHIEHTDSDVLSNEETGSLL